MDASSSPWVIDVDEAGFEEQVLKQSLRVPVVVDFWAPWCGPCRMLGPLLERLVAERNGDVILAKLNTDEAPQLSMEFGISAIPAVKAFRDGKVILEFTGLLPEEHLRRFLDELQPSESDRLVKLAAETEASDPVKSEELFRQAHERDPNHLAARIGLAGVLVVRGALDEAEALVQDIGPRGELGELAEQLRARIAFGRQAASLPPEAELREKLKRDPEDRQSLYELGCVLAAAGRYEEALEALLQAASQDREFARSTVKEAMVRVFHLVGLLSPLADDYRAKLSQILY